jgi:integrase
MASYTFNFNPKAGCFVARVRGPQGGWKTKWLPKLFGRKDEIAAERWLIGWYAEWLKTFGTVSPQNETVVSAPKTVAFLAPKWLALRYNDKGTKGNTFNGLQCSVRNWILDNPKFPHQRVEHLDLETGELTVAVARAWLESIRGSRSSVMQHVGTFRTLINDSIAEEWLSPDLVNPFEKQAIKKILGARERAERRDKVLTFLTAEQVFILLTQECRKVDDFRRMRYICDIATGLRDKELQGLVVSDLVLDAPIPYALVERQLVWGGPNPFVHVNKLTAAGREKNEIKTWPFAVIDDPKRNSKRRVPLHPLLVACLRFWLGVGWKLRVGRAPEPDDPVFPADSKPKTKHHSLPGEFMKPVSAATFRKDLGRLGLPLTCKGKRLVFHSLRHTFSQLLKRAGVYEPTTNEMLGHEAKTVAAKHYTETDLPLQYQAILKLPLPPYVRFRNRLVSSPNNAPTGTGGTHAVSVH